MPIEHATALQAIPVATLRAMQRLTPEQIDALSKIPPEKLEALADFVLIGPVAAQSLNVIEAILLWLGKGFRGVQIAGAWFVKQWKLIAAMVAIGSMFGQAFETPARFIAAIIRAMEDMQ